MTLSEVIKRAASIIGLELEYDYDAPSAALTKLIDCANMIYSELTLEHVPLKTKEYVDVVGGECNYSDLSKNVREILSVRYNGNKLKFTLFPTYFALAEEIDGEVEVEYLFHMGELNESDNLILPGVTRAHMVRACKELGLPCIEDPYTLDELMNAAEVVIVTSGAQFRPVAEVGGVAVGGRAPEIVKKMQEKLYGDFLEKTNR